jgi:hypothetical protein
MPSVGGVPKGQMSGGTWWLFNVLSAITSTLAIVALASHAFVTWSLSAPLALVMDAYNATMQVLVGWAQPYLQAALTWLGSFISWRPVLYVHWRDIVLLTTLWSVGLVRSMVRAFPRRIWAWARVIPFVIGFPCIGLWAGTQPPDKTSVRFWIAATILVAGVFLIDAWLEPRLSDARHRFATVGQSILTGFLGAFCFFAIDAGLKLVMG